MFVSTLLSALLSSQSAQALSCMDGVVDSSPDMDVITLPENGKIMLWNTASQNVALNRTLWLIDEDTGQSVEAELQFISPTVTELIPHEPLQADHMYSLNVGWDDLEDAWPYANFILEDTVDNTAPPQPSVLNVSRDFGTWEWGDWDKQHISIDASVDTAYFEVEIADNPDFQSAETLFAKDYDGVISLGYDECYNNLHEVAVDSITHVRIKAIDLAGNASDWSTVFEVEALDPTDENDNINDDNNVHIGCSSLASPASPALLLFGAAMLGWRRRDS